MQLKKQYDRVKEVKETSGGGWDFTRHIVDLPDNVWDELIKVSIKNLPSKLSIEACYH